MNTKKIRWISILMIFSQLMLTGFVVYWLRSQYRDEKELLTDELYRLYDESSGQVIDSLVFNRVVQPALKDSIIITTLIDKPGDTLKRIKATGLTEKTVTGKAFSTGKVVAMNITGKRQDFLIRSVKLIIDHTADSTKNIHVMTDELPGHPDTTLFKKVFMSKVEDRNLGVGIHWVPDTLFRDTIKHKSGIILTGRLSNQLPGVEIKRDFPYLMGRLAPQIIFALILLLLTGFAFIYTNRSLKRQILLNSLRNDFVSNITHELRTPVSTVKVALEALKTYDKVNNPDITREYLDMASQELNRLDQLIGKVLDQSLIGDQNQVIQPVLSDIRQLTSEAILTLQPRLTARNAAVSFTPDETVDPLMLDPLYYQGIIINLVDNSLKYGGETPEIQISINQSVRWVTVKVGDNGPGIPKEYLDRVFDKFFRVPTGNTHNIKGYGLGLSFAALVMKQHNGHISVECPSGGGTLFTLNFPREQS